MARSQPLSAARLAAFSVVGVATGAFNIPLQTFLPAFYAKTMGLGLETVGLVFLASRLWSAFSDPVIGWLSDHSTGRHGRRKPWVLGGGALFLVATIAVFFPPAGVGAWWLGLGLLALCLGWTATSTPLYAWGGELSREPRQRARIQAYIQTAASVGIFLVLVLPGALDIIGAPDPALRIKAMGGLIVVVLSVGLVLIATLFREPPALAPASKPDWRPAMAAVVRDPRLRRIIASDFFVALGQGSRGAVFVFFVGSYMGLGVASLLLLLQYCVGILAAPLWARISYRLGRRDTLILAELLQVAVNLTILLLTPDRVWLLVVLVVAQGLTQGAGNLMLRAMIYDVADQHRKDRGVEFAGLFSSLFNVTTNAAMALAVSIAFAIIGAFDFSPNGPNDPGALTALLCFFALGPATGHLLSAVIMIGYPQSDRHPLSPTNADGSERDSGQA